MYSNLSNLNKLVILVWQNRRLSHIFFCKVRFFFHLCFWEKSKTWFPKRRIKIDRSAQLLLLSLSQLQSELIRGKLFYSETETEKSMRFLYSQSINIFIAVIINSTKMVQNCWERLIFVKTGNGGLFQKTGSWTGSITCPAAGFKIRGLSNLSTKSD